MTMKYRTSLTVLAAPLALLMVVPLLSASVSEGGGKPKLPVEVLSVQDVAGRSPFEGLSCNVDAGQMQPGGREGEPHIAVNPRNPDNRIAAWMDRARSTVMTAYTKDGGRTWHKSIPLGLDSCTGNLEHPWEANADVWVSFSPDGATAYFTSIPFNHAFTPPNADFIEVLYLQRSDDGGETWSAPVLVPNPLMADDKPMTLVDRRDPKTIYIVDTNEAAGGLPIGTRGITQVLFHRSRDGGRTFDIPNTVVYSAAPNPALWMWNAQLVQLNDGTLVLTHNAPQLVPTSSGDLLAQRSTDQGSSWSQPYLVRHIDHTSLPPVCSKAGPTPLSGEISGNLFATQEGQVALLGGSTVALLTIENHPAQNGSARIILSTSDDAGISWQSDTTITSELPITMASIAANDKGQLGVVYNQVDLTHVDCARDLIPARTVFAVSSDRGRSWTSTLVGPAWWNFGSAGLNPIYGWWLGEFQSLTGTPNGFTTITPQGRALTPRPHPPIVGETGIVVADIHTVQVVRDLSSDRLQAPMNHQ